MVFSKILVAIDGSESAKKAFTKSLFLALKCNSRLDLLHVVHCELGGDSATTFELIEQLQAKAKIILDEYRKEALEKNIPIEVMLKQGDPAQIIIEIANAGNYDLIITGSRGMSAFKELLLGSVTLKVIHHVHCPVMVVR
ncbi:MAG: universal stress protein [Thaumarchaeota archaeon]|nr:universal stress protein [Nitrososphaerota archaeon]